MITPGESGHMYTAWLYYHQREYCHEGLRNLVAKGVLSECMSTILYALCCVCSSKMHLCSGGIHMRVVVILKKYPFPGVGEIYSDVTTSSALQTTFTFISNIILSTFCKERKLTASEIEKNILVIAV